MGRRSRGRRSSRLRARRPSAAKKVPLTTRAQVPSGQDEGEEPDVAEGVEVEEDDEDRGQDGFNDEDEEHVGDGFAEKECGGGGGGHALGFEDLVAQLAGPGLVEGGDGGEEESDPEDATGDLAGDGGVAGGIEGEAEDDDDQEGEEEHPVDGVTGAPLQAEVFAEMVEDVVESSSCGRAFGEVREGGVGGAKVVGGGEEELEAALAGGDGDEVEEFDGLVGVGGEGLLGGHDGDSAADVAGEGFDFFEGG